MADEVRSTQYLYEFAVSGAQEAEAQFRGFLTNIRQYEADLQASLANIDRAMQSGLSGSATGQGTTTFQTQIEQETAAIQRSMQTKRDLEQQNARLIAPTAAAATGASTAIPPWLKGEGTEGLRAFSEQLKNGQLQIGTFERALDDSNKVVERGTLYFDKMGKEIGRTTTVTKAGADGIRNVTTSTQGLTKALDEAGLSAPRFIRHLTWIGQGILLWAGINAVTDALRGWWDVQQQLNASLAEFEMRTGAGAQGMTEYEQGVLDISKSTAQRPGEIAGVAPYAPDLTTMEYAAQLNKVAGGDMQNQMQWLVSQQKQFNVPAEDTIRILNALAGGWKLTTLPMHDYIEMLRYAAPYAKQFNMSIEEMYATFGAAQSVIGVEGKEMDIVFRNLTRLYDPKVQRGLGLEPTSVVMPDGTRQYRDMISILDELSNKLKSSELNAERVANVMGAAGKGQRDLLIGMLEGWDPIKAAMEQTTAAGGNFAEMLSKGLGTTKSKTEELKSAWDRLMASLGADSAIGDFFDVLISGLNSAVDLSEQLQKIWELILTSGKIPPWLIELQDKLVHFSGLWGLAAPFATNTAQATASVGARTPSSFGATATGGRPVWDPTGGQQGLESFPSMFTIPKGGGDFTSLQRSMEQWTNAFSAMGPAFAEWIAQNQDQALIYDENTKTLRLISGFLPALQRAISENTQAQKAQAIEPNLRNVDMNLDESGGMLQQWVQYYTQFLTRMGFPQESKPQLLLGEDDTWIRMWASNEALMLALRALTEATEDQTDVLSGQWNVPEGATMWVPIQSLFYSRGQDKGAPSLGDLPTPPTTLPPQQGNWMNLPGAVAQMTVTDMTVMNWEGLMTTIPPETVAAPEKPSMDPELFKSIIGSLRELDIRKKLSWITEGDKDAGWGDRSPGYINIFEEAAGKGLTASTLEIQSPVTELTSPTVQETIGSANILSTITSMVASSIELTTSSVSGFPTTDTSGMENVLQSMAVTLVMIYNALQTSAPAPIPTYPDRGGGGVQEFAAVSVDELGRYVDQRNYYTFVQKARMRYF
jgi:TP901 family phage tail tape measure protein